MNETLRLIATRYSCRAFADRPPSQAHIEAIAKAAVQSPSAVNRQPWQVIVVTDKAIIEELDAAGMKVLSQAEDKSSYERMMSRGGKLFYDAPVMMMIACQPGTGMDVGILSENICLAAASLGVNSLICGLAGMPFGTEKAGYFKERFGFPEGYEFGIAVLLGYEKAPGTPHEPDMGKISYLK